MSLLIKDQVMAAQTPVQWSTEQRGTLDGFFLGGFSSGKQQLFVALSFISCNCLFVEEELENKNFVFLQIKICIQIPHYASPPNFFSRNSFCATFKFQELIHNNLTVQDMCENLLDNFKRNAINWVYSELL